MASGNKRMAFIFNNINSIDPNDLKSHEVLLDYNTNDLVIVLEDGNTVYLKKYMETILQKYADNHSKDINAHIIASDKNDGFISSEMVKDLYNSIKNVDSISNLISNSIMSNKNTISDFKYNIEENKINVSCSLINGMLKFSLGSKELELFKSEESDIYLSNKYDLLIVHFNNFEDIDYRILDNVEINNNIIVWRNNDYILNVENFCYTNKDDINDKSYFIPLLLINRYTRSTIKLYRQKIDKSLETIFMENCDDINHGYYHTELIEDKLISNSFNSSNNYNKVIISVPFNGSENEITTQTDLMKNVHYTNSYYGKMMKAANHEGNKLVFDNIISFKSQFLLNNNFFTDENIVIYGNNRTDLITFKIEGNNLLIDIVDDPQKDHIIINHIINTDLLYTQITIDKKDNELTIYVNNESTKVLLEINNAFNFIQIPAMNTSLGNILLGTSDIKGHVIDIEKCFNNFSNIIKNTDSDFYNTIPHVRYINPYFTNGTNYSLILSKFGEINKGDFIKLYFYDDLSNEFSKYKCDCEVITKNSLKISEDDLFLFSNNDRVYIESENFKDELDIKFVDRINSILIFKNDIKDTTLNYKVYPKKICVPIKAYIGDDELTNILSENGYYKIIFDKKYDFEQYIKIQYKELPINNVVFNNKLNSIDKIKSITFDNIEANIIDSNDEYIYESDITTNENLNMEFNNKKIENKPLLINTKNDNIDLNIDIDINSTIINSFDVDLLNSIFDFEYEIELTTGSNDLIINEKEYDCKGYMVKIPIKVLVDPDNKTRLNINVKKSTNNYTNKLCIKNIQFKIKPKNIILFAYITSNDGRITDYLVIKDNIIYDTCSTINIKYDNCKIADTISNINYYKKVLEPQNDMMLVEDPNGILKILNINNNHLYNLNKNYVL